MILFWSASNPRSAELLEDFRGYQERWGRDELAIVAVNADSVLSGTGGLKAAREYAGRLDIIFPVLLDPGLVTTAAYGVRELPAAVVIDARGRVSYTLAGYPPALREELKGRLLLAMGRQPDGSGAPVAADKRDRDPAPSPSRRVPDSSCSVPRSRTCTRIHERDPSASDAAALAVRLCNCYGDADAARTMLSGVSKQRLHDLDLRFALGHMMLLKGRTADARRAFERLRDNYPQESWGEWGLGLVALAEGDADGALGHLRAARAGGWSIPEAETAVMKYLEQYWRANRAAPREEQFLALFEDLGPVRACYRRLNQKG